MAQSLYQAFQEALSEGDLQDLDRFKESSFWDELGDDERLKLAHLFLERGEQVVFELGRLDLDEVEDLVNESFGYAEKLASQSAEVLCRQALACYRLGIMAQKGRYYIFALDKLSQAQGAEEEFFDATHEWWHLWGQVLVALSTYTNNDAFLTQAIEKHERAARIFTSEEVLWDGARAWSLLSKQSGELSDVHKAAALFRQAEELGCRLPAFLCDFCEAHLWMAHLTGQTAPLAAAISLCQEAISETESETPTAIHTRAWTLMALLMKKQVDLTGTTADFEAADKMFHEAILAVPHCAPLWLQWGELFLRWAWMKKELTFVESALEKLTSLKINECDPMDVSGLLGMGIILLGLFTEDLKLLKDGGARIEAALEINPNHKDMRYAHAFSLLAQGIYFNDEKFLTHAAQQLQALLEEDAAQTFAIYTLFQCTTALGRLKNDSKTLGEGLELIARICEIRPQSAHAFNEWGEALMHLYEVDRGGQETVEEAATRFQQAMDLEPELTFQFNHGCALDTLGNLTGDEETFGRAVEELADVYQKAPDVRNVGYHLARALLHFGELAEGVESLYQAVDLYQQVVDHDNEDDVAWCELGYGLLNLSELVRDPIHPEKESQLREKAENALLRGAGLGNGPANYHLACLYSLADMPEAALDYLKRAEGADALPSVEDLENDEWLEGIKATTEFQQLIDFRKESF